MKKSKAPEPKQKVPRSVYENRYFPSMMEEAFEQYFCEIVYCYRGIGDFYAGAAGIEDLWPMNKEVAVFNYILKDFTDAYKYDENLDIGKTMSEIIEKHRQTLENTTLFVYGGFQKDNKNFTTEDFEDLWISSVGFNDRVIEDALTNIAIATMKKENVIKIPNKRKVL